MPRPLRGAHNAPSLGGPAPTEHSSEPSDSCRHFSKALDFTRASLQPSVSELPKAPLRLHDALEGRTPGLQDTLSRSVLANGSDRSSTRISKGGRRRRPSPRVSDQARAAHCPLPAGVAGRRELSSKETWADRVQPLPRDTHLLVAAEIRPCYKSLKRISMIAFYDQLTGSRHERGHFRGAAGGREGLPLQADPAEAWGSPSPWEEEKRFFPSCTHRENSQTWLHNFNRESE